MRREEVFIAVRFESYCNFPLTETFSSSSMTRLLGRVGQDDHPERD